MPRKTSKKPSEQISSQAPAKREIYQDGQIVMPSDMITDKESFVKIWQGNLKGVDIEKAWEKAESWLKKRK